MNRAVESLEGVQRFMGCQVPKGFFGKAVREEYASLNAVRRGGGGGYAS